MLNKRLPFYGKRGSIGEISETDDYYQVKTYDIDGKYNDIINVRKTYQDKNSLFGNYYKDVEEYLNLNKDKLDSLSKEEKKVLLNKRMVKVILTISVLIGILPLAVSIVLGNASLWSIGGITLLIGASFSTASIISLKNIKEYEDKEEFKRTYKNLEHELKVYKSELNNELVSKKSKNKSNNRNLTPINRTNDKVNSLIKTKKIDDNKVA